MNTPCKVFYYKNYLTCVILNNGIIGWAASHSGNKNTKPDQFSKKLGTKIALGRAQKAQELVEKGMTLTKTYQHLYNKYPSLLYAINSYFDDNAKDPCKDFNSYYKKVLNWETIPLEYDFHKTI